MDELIKTLLEKSSDMIKEELLQRLHEIFGVKQARLISGMLSVKISNQEERL